MIRKVIPPIHAAAASTRSQGLVGGALPTGTSCSGVTGFKTVRSAAWIIVAPLIVCNVARPAYAGQSLKQA